MVNADECTIHGSYRYVYILYIYICVIINIYHYIHLRIIDAEHLLEKNAKHVGGFMTLKLHKIKKW